jgi:hypothetical protein
MSLLREHCQGQDLQPTVVIVRRTAENGDTFGFFYSVTHSLHISHTVRCSRDFGGQSIYKSSAYQIMEKNGRITNTAA